LDFGFILPSGQGSPANVGGVTNIPRFWMN